jgi:valyl-tRNA synthetase
MKVGRKLAIKILNASKFVLGVSGESVTTGGEVRAPLDRALLAGLADLVEDATRAFDSYDYARALERSERFFWSFCDDYVELVKQRAYRGGTDQDAGSAATTLQITLDALLRLFAPHLPFVTEEVWSWWQDGSVHRASWPDAATLRTTAADGAPLVYVVAADVLAEVRKAKTTARVSLRTEVEQIVVHDTAERLDALAQVIDDVREATRATNIEPVEAEAFAVEVVLAESDAA